MRHTELFENFKRERNSEVKYTDLIKYTLILPSIEKVSEVIERLNLFINIDTHNPSSLKSFMNLFTINKSLIDEKIVKYNHELEKCKEYNIYDEMHKNETFGEFDQSILSWIFDFGYYDFYEHEHLYNDTYEILKEHFNKQLEDLKNSPIVKTDFKKYLDEFSTKQEDMIDHCIEKVYFDYLNELEEICEYFDNLDTRLNANDRSSNINIFRQGFLNLMYIFDHYTFEFVRILLEEKFFDYYKIFVGKDQKTSLKNLKSSNSLEEFINEEVENTLKQYYVKDILNIMRSNGIINGNIEIIIECIKRRNVHVHKNGYADMKYCDEYNLFDKSPGDYLEIDESYYMSTLNEINKVLNDIYNYVNDTLIL